MPIDHVSRADKSYFEGTTVTTSYIVIGVVFPHVVPLFFAAFVMHLTASFTNAIKNRSDFFS